MTAQAQMVQDSTSTDRIEKNVVLRAPRSRVWRAITNAEEFGTWFRMKLDGEIAEGAKLHGKITHPGYEHVCPVEMLIEQVEPERYFSYRWHPYAIDAAVNYSGEPMTLVEFILKETEGGTAVTIVESGFDRIPLARRAEAFRMNDGGWSGQIKNLAQYVA
jgi:uncharacterized protein YndB with AHSA1/START domain